MSKGFWTIAAGRPAMGLALALVAFGLVVMCAACTDLNSEQPPLATAAAPPATTTLPVTITLATATTSLATATTSPVAAIATTGSNSTAASVVTVSSLSIAMAPTTATPTTQRLATEISLLPTDAYLQFALRNYETVFANPPTPRDMAAVDSDLKLTFAYDPTARGVTPGTLSPLKTRVYQILMLMQMLEFSEPLPWTDMSLWDWFCSSVDEIRFEQADYDPQFANGIIYMPIGPNAILVRTGQFIDPQLHAGLMDILVLFVHEARHAQKDHTEANGTMDKTIAELGSWGVAYYMYFFLADKANFFLDASARQLLYSRAEDTKQTRFTEEP